jgi:hypothetical protein
MKEEDPSTSRGGKKKEEGFSYLGEKEEGRIIFFSLIPFPNSPLPFSYYRFNPQSTIQNPKLI